MHAPFLLGTSRTHRISPTAIVMITGSKCRHQVTDQELVAQHVTRYVMVTTIVRVSPLITTVELVTLTWFCFSRNLSWLCQWHFAELITVKKKSWHGWPSVGSKNVTNHALITPIVLSIISDYHNWVRDADMDFVSVTFFMTLTVTFFRAVSSSLNIIWHSFFINKSFK